MTTKGRVKPDEDLMMMLELENRLKEQIDKLEHVRLAAVELKDNLSGVHEHTNTQMKYIDLCRIKSVLIFCGSEQQ